MVAAIVLVHARGPPEFTQCNHHRALEHALLLQILDERGEVVARARKHLRAEKGAIPDPLLRDEIASLGMLEEAFHLTLARIQQGSASGTPGPEGSITKIVV